MPDKADDFELAIEGTDFIWSAWKAAKNVHRHGVTFEQAATVFFDYFAKAVDASRNGQRRDGLIGHDKEFRLLCVVHCGFEGDRIGIISAWPATSAERKLYDDQ